MAEVLLSVLLAAAVSIAAAGLLYAMARYVGLGRCLKCRRGCPPWAAYCWRHDPFNEDVSA